MEVNDKVVRARLTIVKREIRRIGLLPFTDPEVPSVVSLVAETRVAGSWWGHPAGQLIYQVGETLDADSEVLLVRLWRGKQTLVHRRLWPALVRIGLARSPWQTSGLSETARVLLAHIEREGQVRNDRFPQDFPMGAQPFRAALRTLELRLLLLTRSVHTSTGAHALEAESWRAWKSRTRTPTYSGSVASAERAFEQAALRLTPLQDPLRTVPWGRSRGKAPPPR